MSILDITKVIGGSRYSTLTATEICTYRSPAYRDDFQYEVTSLYVTQKGRFFLAGEGGALSRWSRAVAGGTAEGEGLVPVSETEAREFAEAHADADTVAEFFAVEDA